MTISSEVRRSMALVLWGILIHFLLAVVKLITGWLGNSYALIADGIESCADVLSSLIVCGGLRIATRPADANHPYGHGRAETIASALGACAILIAAGLIVWQSIREIMNPHHAPAWFTLPVLLIVIMVKEILFRKLMAQGKSINSSAMRVDAWHHRLDALTSLAAFVGISIALIGGVGYESADDWAALLACVFITYQGWRMLRTALDELMDSGVYGSSMNEDVLRVSESVKGVVGVDKFRVRKVGLHYSVDIHVMVDGSITVREGHDIAHAVKDALIHASLGISEVLVHVEPYS